MAMKRVKVFLLAVIIFFAMLLNGCEEEQEDMVSAIDDEVRGKVSVSFFSNQYEELNVRVIEEIITDYMTENPDVCITYESLKGSAYYDALIKRMATNNGDDIFMLEHDTLLRFKNMGCLEDLSSMRVVGQYNDKIREQISDEEGSVYMLPTKVAMYGLYCNMDILKKYHQRVPENLEQWRKCCDYFVEKGITPIVANNDISLKTMAIGIGFYDLYKNDNSKDTFEKINVGDEELSQYLKDGFKVVEEFIDKGYINKEIAIKTERTQNDLLQFQQGEAPFMLTGVWAAGRVVEAEPKLNFQVYPLPILEDKNVLVVSPENCLAINKNSKNKNLAYSFVEYFTQNKYIEKFSNQQCSLSPLKEFQEPTAMQTKPLLKAYYKNDIVLAGDNYLKLPILDCSKDVCQMLLKGQRTEDALLWLDEKMEEEREKNNNSLMEEYSSYYNTENDIYEEIR